MIDVSRFLQLFGLWCSSFKPFLLFMGSGLAMFSVFAIIKLIMRSRHV